MQQAGTFESRDDTPMDDEEFGKKSEEIYAMAKEIIAQESDFKQALTESEHRQKLLESQIISLRKSFASYISPGVHNELREKYLESNMRLRAALESRHEEESEAVRNKVVQDLRDELVSLHKQLSELATSASANKNNVDSKALEDSITELRVENEKLKKTAELARDEALVHRAIDSTVLAEFNDLRQRILKFDLDEGSEIKETARLSLELANCKVIETELREQKKMLECELLRMREELAEIRKRECEEQAVEKSYKQADIRYLQICTGLTLNVECAVVHSSCCF